MSIKKSRRLINDIEILKVTLNVLENIKRLRAVQSEHPVVF